VTTWWRIAAVVALVLVVGAILTYRPTSGVVCDADVPEWALKDYYPNGCGTPPPLYEYLLPWHWNAKTVCTFCTDLARPSPS
jgi:hypothetical protein